MGGDAVRTLHPLLHFLLLLGSPSAIIWLRQMSTISQTEDHLCAVLRSQERDVHLGCWLPDLNIAHLARPSAAHGEVGAVNGFGKFEYTSAWFLRAIKHNRCSMVPVHAGGAGGWVMF